MRTAVLWFWNRPRLLGAVIVGLALPFAHADGQRRNVTASVGISEYDLSGTGTTGVGGLTASFPLTSFLSVDPGFGFLRYRPQLNSDHVSYLIPEVSVRVQIPGPRVNPYLLVGGGVTTVVEGSAETDPTLHTAIGAYLWLTRSWALRPEARVRSVEPWVGTTGDLTFGVSRRF